VCFRGGKAPTRRNLGAASLISFVMISRAQRPAAPNINLLDGRKVQFSQPGEALPLHDPDPKLVTLKIR
jgi:hypothetical protein